MVSHGLLNNDVDDENPGPLANMFIGGFGGSNAGKNPFDRMRSDHSHYDFSRG